MSQTLRTRLLITGSLAVILLLVARESLFFNGKASVYFLDVGQGDATLVVTPSGKQILIDGGPNMGTLEYLGSHMPFFDRNIELMIITHPDADHITALAEVLRRYSIDRVLLSGVPHESARYKELLDMIALHETTAIPADPGMTINMGDGLQIDVLWPPADTFGTEKWGSNNASVVVKVRTKHQSLILPGDIEEEAEQALLALGSNLHADILKVPHHGSRTSSSTGFILAVAPKLAIISSGSGNSFGHPHPDVVDRYEHFGVSLRNTATEGTVSLPL